MEIIPDENMISTSTQKRGRTSRGLTMNRRSRKVAARNLPIVGDPALSEAIRCKKLAAITPPCHFVLKYMIPSMLALVALKYQGKTDSLFVENPMPLWCFLIAICVYWAIVGGTKQMPSLESDKYLLIFSRSASAIGLLSALSLLSILLPHQVWVVPFIIWMPLPLVFAWPMLYAAYSWLSSPIKTLCNRNRAKSVSRETTLRV